MGRKIIDYVIDKSMSWTDGKSGVIGVVIGHRKEEVKEHLTANFTNIKFAVQKEQLGTADALRSYFADVKEASQMDYTMVVCGDTPLLDDKLCKELFKKVKEENLDGVVASFKINNPKGYGRVIQSKKGIFIIEEKDASEEQRQIKEVNSGVYLLKTSFVLEHLDKINTDNKSGEFYLTDLFKEDYNVASLCLQDAESFLGINTIVQLQEASSVLRMRKNRALMEEGVLIIDPATTYIDWNVKIGSNVIIEPGVVIKDSVIENDVAILAYSYLEGAKVCSGAQIGPFARLRTGADIGSNCKIGNFVEVKKAVMHPGSKASHLTYIGDAEIGERTNIGCGFITCNYDGANKHKTTIGKDCFIGSDCQAIAPVTLGDESFVAAGTTITNNLDDGDFAVGRCKQVTKKGMASRFLKHKK